jgi:membrane protease YdiL (CAAX protease family)
LNNRDANARRRDIGIVAFVFLLIFSYIWIWRRSFSGAAAIFAIALAGALMLAHAQRAESLHDVGFRLDTFTRASVLLAPLAVVVIAFTVLVGHELGSARFPAGSAAVLPIAKLIAFGLAQQYVLLGFFYRRLERALATNALALVATAAVFAVLHLPNPFLMAVTFFAGLVGAIVYQRAPNLWVNGIAHGLISYCLFYALSPEVTGALRVGPGYWVR